MTVVDIGSGSMKASVFVHDGGKVYQVASISHAYRLCPKIGDSISLRKKEIAAKFIGCVKDLALQNGSNLIIAVATQAARAMNNIGELQSVLQERHGVNLVTISGEEEAKLFALSVRRSTEFDKFISFDAGCGSVDIAEFNEKFLKAWSCPISSISLSKIGNLNQAKKIIDDTFNNVHFISDDLSGFKLVGSGGVLKIAVRLLGKCNRNVDYQSLNNLYNKLVGMSDDERVKFGVPMSRADVMPYGLLIILRLMKKIGIDNLILCVGNLRSGIAIRYFDKH